MSLLLATTLPTYVFTSQIPDVHITTTYTQVTATLTVGGTTVHTTTLYPYNGHAVLTDLRSIIEETLLARELCFAAARITVTAGDNITATSPTFYAIYCAHSLPTNLSAEEYLRTHFLTTRQDYTLPRQDNSLSGTAGALTFTGLAFPGETLTLRAIIVVEHTERDSYELQTVTSTLSEQSYEALSTFSLSITYDSILTRASGIVQEVGRVLAFTIWAGSRSLNIFCTDNTPDLSFLFRNPFGIYETLALTAVTRQQLEKTASTAILARKLSLYDISLDGTYKTEVANLTFSQSATLLQLYASPGIRLIDPALDDFNDYPEVLIESLDCNPSDTDDGLQTATLEWRFADRRPRLMRTLPTASEGIFTSEYTPTFT